MKFLLDENISKRVIPLIQAELKDVDYLLSNATGLIAPVSDHAVWKFAKENELIIISNDSDFLNLLNQKGFPPKIVLLKTGNQSNHYIESLLIKHAADILDLVNDDSCGFLEIF